MENFRRLAQVLTIAILIFVQNISAYVIASGENESISMLTEERFELSKQLIHPDPLPVRLGWTADGDQNGAYFGETVIGAGDVNGDGYPDVLVGATYYDNGEDMEGKVYGYYGNPSGLSAIPSWTAEGNQPGIFLGQHMSSAGDVNGDGYDDVIFGLPYYDSGSTDVGKVIVYYGSSSGLAQDPSWSYEGVQSNAGFGKAISGVGDLNGDGYDDIIVGTPGYVYTRPNEGRVDVFHGSADGLSANPTLSVGGFEGARFGKSVSGGGDFNSDGFDDVIIGAEKCTTNEIVKGCVYAFHGSASGISSPNWIVPGNKENSGFGDNISVVGDVNNDGFDDTVIGAPTNDYAGLKNGAVFGYYGSTSGLSTNPNWTINGDQEWSYFGKSISGAGDMNGDGFTDVIIGAPNYDNGDNEEEGRVFTYYGSSAGLSLESEWTPEINQSSVWIGTSVSGIGDINGDGFEDVIVGANGSNATAGRALIYYGSEISPLMHWSDNLDQANSEYGKDARSAGDVNGDGYADVIIGAPFYDNGQEDEGRVVVYYGSATGLPDTPNWTEENNLAGSWFGYSVGTAGDVNNDGFDDVIIGAPSLAGINGRAYVYLGSSTGLPDEPSWTRGTLNSNSSFGYSVGTAGDVNGDGYNDVIIGASTYDEGLTNRGQALIYYGTSTGVSETPSWTVMSDQEYSNFGSSVGTAGDVNGDGYSDVLVGANSYSNGNPQEGKVFCYYGSVTGPSTITSWSAESNHDYALFGYSLGTAGDVNGDGFDDVIIGAYSFDGELINEGIAYVFHGSGLGLSETANWSFEGDQASALFGYSVATAGDADGDGFEDILVSAISYDDEHVDEGRVFLFLGSTMGLPDSYSWNTESNQPGGYYGESVASAGDINGDGYSDIVLGSPDVDLNQINEGKVDVLYMAKPIANAGSDQEVNRSVEVSLDGAGSYNFSGNIYLSYSWQQISGPLVTLNNPSVINPTFTAPGSSSVLVFSLVVTNLQGITSVVDEVTIFVASTPPVSDAGPDQGVPPDTYVSLNGESSFDPFDNYPITFAWSQIGGSIVTLDDPSSATPSFTTPSALGDLTFSLMVTNNLGLSDLTPDEVVIHVTNPPISNAGPDQVVNTLAEVFLDGSGSFDPDEDTPLTYLWTQTSGNLVELNDPTLANPTFTAPADPESYTFTLTVTDSLGCPDLDGDVVNITVSNQAPISDAGPDQSVNTSDSVTLDGSLSVDPDRDLPLIYSWVQTSGTIVTLSDPTIVNPTFTAPSNPTLLKFSLIVWDSLGLIDSTPDEVNVTVNNQEPISNAGPDQSHNTLTLVTLDASESYDPDDDEPLSFLWTQVTGFPVELSSYTAEKPTFIAPSDPGIVTFSLVVTDSLGLSDATPDTVEISILNQVPFSNAGPDQWVDLGDLVTLDGSGSSDPDGDYPLTYLWLQIGGPTVVLNSTTDPNPTFLAPNETSTLSFILFVTDQLGLTDATADQVNIFVNDSKFIFLPVIFR